MSTPPTTLRMVALSGAEVLWLLEGSALGRLVCAQREATVIRPDRHVWEYGRLVVRTPAPATAAPAPATYHVDEVHAAPGTGWTVTVSGPVEVISDRDKTAHYQRTLGGWTHGPHDTILRLHLKSVTGFRLTSSEA